MEVHMSSPNDRTKPMLKKTLEQAREVEYDLIAEMSQNAFLMVKNTIGEKIGAGETVGTLYAAQKKALEKPKAKKLGKDWKYRNANVFYLEIKDFLAGKEGSEKLAKEVIQKGYEAQIALRNQPS